MKYLSRWAWNVAGVPASNAAHLCLKCGKGSHRIAAKVFIFLYVRPFSFPNVWQAKCT